MSHFIGRYSYLPHYINKFKPETLLEVGTWTGQHAVEMIEVALKHQQFVRYYGFDLFDNITDEQILTEQSKARCSLKETATRLQNLKNRYPGRVNFELIRGNTHDTLAKFKSIYPVDFIFIDGGHSLSTINNDFFWTSQMMQPNKTIMLLDDYYANNSLLGCKPLIDRLQKEKAFDAQVLGQTDVFPKPTGELRIQFARVIKTGVAEVIPEAPEPAKPIVEDI